MHEVITLFTDIVTLLYHEARNVRHLLKKAGVPPEFQVLRDGLATNRYEAWRQLQPVRREAASQLSGSDVERVFKSHFGLAIDDLVDLYNHHGWKGSDYGGNAWLPIAIRASEIRDLIDAGEEKEADELAGLVLVSSHNTGKVGDKLRDLDRWVADHAR